MYKKCGLRLGTKTRPKNWPKVRPFKMWHGIYLVSIWTSLCQYLCKLCPWKKWGNKECLCQSFKTRTVGKDGTLRFQLKLLGRIVHLLALTDYILITWSESTDSLTEVLHMYKSILPPGIFSIHGCPESWMTNDCDALRLALRDVFPSSNLYICVFHILQAIWRWLMDGNHSIPQQKR